MIISFGDGAAETFRSHVATIPAGYVVALLRDGEGADQIRAGSSDAVIVTTTPEGVAYRSVPLNSDRPYGPIKIIKWEELARVHVY